MKIGILGGTFDPIHLGHLVLAEEVADKLKLDKVIFVPAFVPVHKKRRNITGAGHRLNMVRLAIKGNKKFEVSDMEIKAKKPCYTVDTLSEFKKKYKNARLYFIAGSDSVFQLSKWKNIEKIFRLAAFAVGGRPGFPIEGMPKKVAVVKINPVDISSSQLRDFIRHKHCIRYLVPEPVRQYIIKNRLYR